MHQLYGQRVRNIYGVAERDAGDIWLKVDIRSFNGSLSIEEFLDWTAEIDKFFNYLKTALEKRVRLIVYCLKGKHMHG